MAHEIQLLHQSHFFLSIPVFPKNFYFLRYDRVDGPANVIRLDGQLTAETPVYQYAEFYLCRPAKIEQGIQRRPYGTAGIQHIVNEDNIFIFYAERDTGVISRMQNPAYIIAVKGNVEPAVADVCRIGQRFELLNDSFRYIYASRLDADEHCIIEADVVFEYLVTQALYGDRKLLFVQDRLQEIFYKNNANR